MLWTFLILQTATTRLQAVKAINLNTLYPFHLGTLAPWQHTGLQSHHPDPSCSWQTPTTTRLVDSNWSRDVALANSHLIVERQLSYVFSFLRSCFRVRTRFHCQVLLLAQRFQSSCAKTEIRSSLFLWTVSYFLSLINSNLSTSPRQSHVNRHSNFSLLAFLLCSPHAAIQSRQVWATGIGNL